MDRQLIAQYVAEVTSNAKVGGLSASIAKDNFWTSLT